MEDLVAVVFFLLMFVMLPIWCYRCCCRRTTQGGRVYNPTSNTSTSVTVNLPPQQVTQPLPYPTVVPYPQQMPYPPQYATNPYYKMPPPEYNQAVGTQPSASAPQYMMG